MDLQPFIDTLKKDCGPFLSVLKSSNTFLYRGFWVKGEKRKELHKCETGIVYFKSKPKKDRKPKDMERADHDELNELLKKKFGWKPRSQGVFATGDQSEAGAYGDDFLFFPIGEFKYVWSRDIKDLFQYIRDKREKESIEPDFQEIVDTYTDKDIIGAIKKGHELSIKCSSYYAVFEASVRNTKKEFMRMLIK